MRLLKLDSRGEFILTEDFLNETPPYAILSHTWGKDHDEVSFSDLENGLGKSKAGYTKLQFCWNQARKDGLEYFWVDTCCINKANLTELSEAITSMFRWYRDAVKCYVYLADVLVGDDKNDWTQQMWEPAFRISRWFTRGWTLQELIAPSSVEFYSVEGKLLGNKMMLEALIHEITGIPATALHGAPLSHFPKAERLHWAAGRHTKRTEDKAYCLLGIFGISMSLRYGKGEDAFMRLKGKINKRSDSPVQPVPTHWTVTRPPNTLFTGREDILQELEGIFREAMNRAPGQIPCQVVITGIGGQGKSEICLQLAHRQRQMFWGVFWIDVSTTSMAQRALLDLAHKLSIPAQTWEEACLGFANLRHAWLLVLDNADNPSVDYQQYIPTGPLGVVILTSRNEECQRYATAKSITLEGLSDQAAQELLLKIARVPDDQQAILDGDTKKVASLLQSHPLALIQAGAYVSRGHCTMAQYPSVYQRQRQRLLVFRPTQAQSRYGNVYATFEASADILKNSATETARDALQVLPLLAVCGYSRFPLPLFEAGWRGAKVVSLETDDDAADDNVLLLTPWHVAHLPLLINSGGDTWDCFRLLEAVQLLKAFALVSTDSQNSYLSVSMHPLVHAWARDRQRKDEQHDSWLQVGCLITFGQNDEILWRNNGRQLQSHIEALTEWEVDKMFAAASPMLIARVLVNCGWLLHRLRSDAKLSMLLEKLYSHLKLDWLTPSPQWIGLYELAGRNLLNYGMVKEAVALLEKVVKIREQSLAEDHPSQLASQHELAGAYVANGQVKEAAALLERVLKIQKQSLAEDHPDRLTAQHNLAIYIWHLGSHKTALDMMARVVTVRRQVLDASHSDWEKSEDWLDYFKDKIAKHRL